MANLAYRVLIGLLIIGLASRANAEITVDEVIEANHAVVTSLAAIKVYVKTTYRNEIPEVEELNQEYTYAMQGEHERISMRPISPRTMSTDFSGLTLSLDAIDRHNGPSGYRGLSNYDGQVDDEGNFPVDSPANGEDGPARDSVGYHWVRYHLGLEPLCSDGATTLPLKEICEQAESYLLAETPNGANQQCYVVEVKVQDGAHRVWLSPEHNFAIRRMDWNGKKQISFRVHEFQVRDGLNLCRSWVVEQVSETGFKLTMDGVVDVDLLNTSLADQDLYVEYPEGLPFFDHRLGRSGVWGDGQPALMFASDIEAREWFDERRKSYAATHPGSGQTPQKRPYFLYVNACFVLIIVGWLSYGRVIKRRSSPAISGAGQEG